jgi:hypothetical protein
MKNLHLYVAIPLFVCFARIELRDAPIIIQDGLSGTAAIEDMSVMAGDTTLSIDTIVLNTDETDLVPIGARFTIAAETGSPVHTVTARTPTDEGPTTSITFTPALAAGAADEAVITFLPQRIEVKIGEGNLTYTETRNMEYLLDRGDLDTVKEGDQVPMEVSLEFTYEHVTTGTGEVISPVDAVKRKGSASEWVSTSPDLCEPFSVDIIIEHNTPCGTAQDEKTTFPDFRYETLNFDLSAATISVQGKCNATEPEVERLTLS